MCDPYNLVIPKFFQLSKNYSKRYHQTGYLIFQIEINKNY